MISSHVFIQLIAEIIPGYEDGTFANAGDLLGDILSIITANHRREDALEVFPER